MSKRTFPDDLNDWSSENYESFISELQDRVERFDEPYETGYEDEEDLDGDLYGLPEETAEEPSGSVASGHMPSRLQLQRVLTWHYDDSGYYAYVLLNGDESQLKRTTQLLESKRIFCALSGRSYRPANNRKQYDWYIRVFKRTDGGALAKLTTEEIVAVMPSLSKSATSYDSSGDFVTAIRQEAERLRDGLGRAQKEQRIAELALRTVKLELQQKEQEYRQVTAKLLALETRSKVQWTQFQQQRTELEGRLFALAQEIDKYRQTAEEVEERELEGSIEMEELRGAIAQRQTEYDEIEEIWRQTEVSLQEREQELVRVTNERDIMRAELELARDELDDFGREHIAQQNLAASVTSLFSQSEEDMEQLLGVLLPNVRFIKGSVTFLFRETKDPLLALKELQQLSTAPGSVKCWRVESTKDWREMHFNTGDSDLGRMYFTKPNNSQYFQVLVSHKGVQKRDFRRLARWKAQDAQYN